MDDLFTTEVVKTLRDENQALRNTPTGTRCRVCDQRCKTYHRPMYGTQARRLLMLYKKTKGDPSICLHVSQFIVPNSGSDGGFAFLVHWGLIWPGEDRGFWGITAQGIAFVQRRLRVPKKAILYDDTLIGFHDHETIAITDVLPEPFDFAELMRA